MKAMSGMHVVSLAINVPGPVATAELHGLGARVCKIEPPAGDPLAQFSPPWYDRLCADAEVITLDLKSAEGMAELEKRLDDADLLLTASRPAALSRLGLEWSRLHTRFPRLCHVGIIGYPPPHENRAGHDLTYQASQGTLQPPGMPKVLLADMAGAQQAVTAALALLLNRARHGVAGQSWVALADAAERFAVTLREQVTTPGAILGNGLPTYNIYATQDGHVALAALEPHFHARLLEALQVRTTSQAELTAFFGHRDNAESLAWAEQHEIPLAIVQ